MLWRTALPRRHLTLKTNVSGRAKRTPIHTHGPSQQVPNSASPDPIDVLSARAQAINATAIPRTSVLRRFIRGVLYASLFGATGFFAAWGWKTWAYLRVGQSIGQPTTRQRHKEWFNSHINGSALVKSLREDGWVEGNIVEKESLLEASAGKPISKRGQHMVNERLVGNGYLATRHFRHPTDGMSVLVFMADFGCESWPSTLHGGVATTVIQEALDTHLRTFPDYAPIRNRETTMNYRLPLAPGIMYSVFVRTDGVEYPYQSAGEPDKSFMGVAVEVLLNEMDQAPRYVEKYNEKTKTIDHVCHIHNVRSDVSAYVKGGSILFLASKDFRKLLQNDLELIPALKEKRDAWLRSYSSSKATSKA